MTLTASRLKISGDSRGFSVPYYVKDPEIPNVPVSFETAFDKAETQFYSEYPGQFWVDWNATELSEHSWEIIHLLTAD